MTGAIPAGIGYLDNLTVLDISGNKLTGTIPAEIGNMRKFELYSSLARNKLLEGEFPADLGWLSELEVLNVARNELRGNVTRRMGRIEKLKRLILIGNKVRGRIPD
ncbi:MAG: hypothetical protein V8R91_16500 [Butyricimonas faecihominis]